MNYAQMIIPFIGGLALFIYGMRVFRTPPAPK